jgi:hypothetical protein
MTRHVGPPLMYNIFTSAILSAILSKLEAQSGFDGKRLIQSFGNYLGESRGSDLASVVHVGVGRVQSTWRRVGHQGKCEW